MAACFFGLITNGFVLGVNLWDWIRSVRLTTSDFHMFSMALTNLLLQVWSAANWMCELSKPQGEVYFCNAVYALKLMFSSSSLLLTASLCLFYCSKIVMFKSRLLRRVQKHITNYYWLIILASVLLCVTMALPLAWMGDDEENSQRRASLVPCNATKISYMSIYRSVLVTFGYTMPVFCVLLSAYLILRSLTKHMRKMHVTIRTGHGVRMEAHVQAGYTVLSLSLLFLAYFALSLLLITKLAAQGSMIYYICYASPMVYSLIHSLVMIKGNGKLRRTVAGFMRHLLWVN
ncbi:taste receptor type 2 member 119-like [Mantella aurantiaca]